MTLAGCRGVLGIVSLWAVLTMAVLTVAVFTSMIYSIISFQRSHGANDATGFSGTFSQIAWSLVPMSIFLCISLLAVKALLFTDGYCGF